MGHGRSLPGQALRLRVQGRLVALVPVKARVDGIGEGGHRRELEVVGVVLGRFGGRTPAGPVVAPVDPYRRQSLALGRHVVVEQALRHVEQLVTVDTEFGERRVEGLGSGWPPACTRRRPRP